VLNSTAKIALFDRKVVLILKFTGFLGLSSGRINCIRINIAGAKKRSPIEKYVHI